MVALLDMESLPLQITNKSLLKLYSSRAVALLHLDVDFA